MLGTRGKIFVAVLIGAFAVSSLALADLPARADEIKTHLEMLGYTVEKTDKALRCKHDKHVNIFVRSYKGGILISGYFTGNEYSKTHRAEFLEFINTLNKEATVIRGIVEGECMHPVDGVGVEREESRHGIVELLPDHRAESGPDDDVVAGFLEHLEGLDAGVHVGDGHDPVEIVMTVNVGVVRQ